MTLTCRLHTIQTSWLEVVVDFDVDVAIVTGTANKTHKEKGVAVAVVYQLT